MKVLVTGGNGFLGRHLINKLISKGCEVISYDHYVDGNNIENCQKFYGDISDVNALTWAMKGVSSVIHLAAEISIPKSYNEPELFIKTNIEGSLNVFKAAKASGVKKIIHTSTSEVYGTAITTPMSESHLTNPSSPYAATKLAADKLAESFYKSFDLPVIILRPFNMYGAGQSDRALLPTLISQVLTKKSISVGRLDTIRDYTYVDDTAEAYIKAIESKDEALFGETINVGGGGLVTGKAALEIIMETIGKKVKIKIDKNRIRPSKSEVLILHCDSTKAHRLLNWIPKISFEEGIKRTVEYIKKNLDSYAPHKYNI